MTRQPLWVILCHLPEKGRREIEEMKKRDRGERGKWMKDTEEIKRSPSTHTCCKDSRPCPTVSQYQLDTLMTQDTWHLCHPDHPRTREQYRLNNMHICAGRTMMIMTVWGLHLFFFFFFFFFFDLGFTALSRIFHLYRADRSSKVGENRSTRRKTTWPSVSRTWLSHIWPELGSNHSGEKPNGLRVNSLIH